MGKGNKPQLILIDKSIAHPYIADYSSKYGIETPKDPSAGHNVVWIGAEHKGSVCAVLGLLEIEEGVMVWGVYSDHTYAGRRCLAVFADFVKTIKAVLWGFVRKNNAEMLQYVNNIHWEIVGDNGVEYLVRSK